MLPLLDTPGFRERALPLSVETWHWMIERGVAPPRAELLQGLIVEKMSKSPLHTKLLDRLWKAFDTSLGKEFWVRKEEPLTLADSEPEPDLAVVPGREADYTTHPVTALLV
jgi:Putative restriction endonuclease